MPRFQICLRMKNLKTGDWEANNIDHFLFASVSPRMRYLFTHNNCLWIDECILGYPNANGIIICRQTENNFWKPRVWASFSKLLAKIWQGSWTVGREYQEKARRIPHIESNNLYHNQLIYTSLNTSLHQRWQGMRRIKNKNINRRAKEREKRRQCIISHTWQLLRCGRVKLKASKGNSSGPNIFTIKWKKKYSHYFNFEQSIGTIKIIYKQIRKHETKAKNRN